MATEGGVLLPRVGVAAAVAAAVRPWPLEDERDGASWHRRRIAPRRYRPWPGIFRSRHKDLVDRAKQARAAYVIG